MLIHIVKKSKLIDLVNILIVHNSFMLIHLWNIFSLVDGT